MQNCKFQLVNHQVLFLTRRAESKKKDQWRIVKQNRLQRWRLIILWTTILGLHLLFRCSFFKGVLITNQKKWVVQNQIILSLETSAKLSFNVFTSSTYTFSLQITEILQLQNDTSHVQCRGHEGGSGSVGPTCIGCSFLRSGFFYFLVGSCKK